MNYFLFFSICCCANALAIKSINEEKIEQIARFVREQLKRRLEEQCERNQYEMDDDEKELFFGLYYAKPEEFDFLPGEGPTIEEIAKEVRRMVDRDGENSHLDEFIPPDDFKMSKKDTCRVFGCIFFGQKSNGRKRQRVPMHLMYNDVPEAEPEKPVASKGLKKEFLHKLKAHFEEKDPSLRGKDYLSDDMVQIINNAQQITAVVDCVFCLEQFREKRKKLRVQFNVSARNGLAYWNFANLKRHISSHTIKDEQIVDDEQFIETDSAETEKKTEKPVKIIANIELSDENSDASSHSHYIDVQSLVIVPQDTIAGDTNIAGEAMTYETYEVAGAISMEDEIYNQIAAQNLFMTEAVHTHNEYIRTMMFLLNDEEVKLKVIKISADGNCLYGSLAHQLFGHKVNSADHTNATVALRESAVKFIENHFNDFQTDLFDRVFHEREIAEKANTKKRQTKNRNRKLNTDVTVNDCKKILINLKNGGIFGGAESIRALSNVHGVNILFFNESGQHCYPLNFNPNLNRTVFLAYRLDKFSKYDRNHYDSVAEVNPKILLDCAKVLSENESKKEEYAQSDSTVVLE